MESQQKYFDCQVSTLKVFEQDLKIEFLNANNRWSEIDCHGFGLYEDLDIVEPNFIVGFVTLHAEKLIRAGFSREYLSPDTFREFLQSNIQKMKVLNNEFKTSKSGWFLLHPPNPPGYFICYIDKVV